MREGFWIGSLAIIISLRVYGREGEWMGVCKKNKNCRSRKYGEIKLQAKTLPHRGADKGPPAIVSRQKYNGGVEEASVVDIVKVFGSERLCGCVVGRIKGG